MAIIALSGSFCRTPMQPFLFLFFARQTKDCNHLFPFYWYRDLINRTQTACLVLRDQKYKTLHWIVLWRDTWGFWTLPVNDGLRLYWFHSLNMIFWCWIYFLWGNSWEWLTARHHKEGCRHGEICRFTPTHFVSAGKPRVFSLFQLLLSMSCLETILQMRTLKYRFACRQETLGHGQDWRCCRPGYK